MFSLALLLRRKKGEKQAERVTQTKKDRSGEKKARNELNRFQMKIQEKHEDGIPHFVQNMMRSTKYADMSSEIVFFF